MTSKLLLAALAALLLAGCSNPAERTYWHLRHEPSTDAERRAVAEQVVKIMQSNPSSLAGAWTGWDDAINAATRSAKETLCKPTMWEQMDGYRTGRWRYAEGEAQTPNSSPK